MRVREGTASDARTIYEIGTECFSDAWREETVAADMEKPHSLYLVAEGEDGILGYACLWLVEDELQLVNIGVRKAQRRNGIASALLEKTEEEAVSKKASLIYLEVRVSNVAAQELYRKFGFKVQAIRKGVYSLPKEDGYIMGKRLEQLVVSS